VGLSWGGGGGKTSLQVVDSCLGGSVGVSVGKVGPAYFSRD